MRAADGDRFRVIAQAAKQLTSLTEDMLLLARADQPMEEDVFFVDLSTLIDGVAELYRADFERSGITLRKRMPRGIMIYGNPDHLHRLFANLVINALKYTPRGGTVEIEGIQQRGGALVHVRDSGIGISEEQLPKLFDRFWRAEAARTRSTGTGLGLPIARALARRHGGDITVASTVGKGSDFTVTLPAHPPS
jgi:signal transduction histidine kinase